MYIKNVVVGLGNPSIEYAKTFHNIGFMFIDYYTSKIDEKVKFLFDKKSNIYWFKTTNSIFIKPQGYMNNSGQVVKKYIHYNKIEYDKFIIVYDDLDIQKYLFKIHKKMPRQHNGVNSFRGVFQNTDDFYNIRVGIGDEEKIGGIDYVLKKISESELHKFEGVFDKIACDLDDLLGE